MSADKIHISLPYIPFEQADTGKGAWLVLLHAGRVPPHAGLLINGSYSSLTIKGHELNVAQEALLKTIQKKQIEAIFIKIVRHPVFSASYQGGIFAELVKKEEAVKQDSVTCLWPIKLFFREFYAVPLVEHELLFEFMQRLHENKFAESFSTLHISPAPADLELPVYSAEELRLRIINERIPFYKD